MPQFDEDYRVHNPKIERLLKDIGLMLGRDMPDGWGFNLLIFSFGEGGSTFYISNANREDMIKTLENDFLPILKGQK